MKIFATRMNVVFTACYLLLFLLNITCNTNSPTQPPPPVVEKIIEIVQPIAGDALSLFNPNIIVVKCNPDSIITPLNRYFSTNKMQLWKPMTAKVLSRRDFVVSGKTVYRYEVMSWKPLDDTLSADDTIYIKVNSYNGPSKAHTIGPLTLY